MLVVCFICDISCRYSVYPLSRLFALNPMLYYPEMHTYRMNNRILLYNTQTLLLRYRVCSFAFLFLSWHLPPYRVFSSSCNCLVFSCNSDNCERISFFLSAFLSALSSENSTISLSVQPKYWHIFPNVSTFVFWL